MSLAREPCKPPAVPTRVGIPTRQILFRHPGYDDSSNVLLKLFAPDVGQTSTAHGLYAQYALQACGVVAGNRWDGWLSEAKDPDTAAAVDSTSILEKSSYYFHLPPLQIDVGAGHPNLPYPIVPTFREWRFPHDDLPELWKRTASTDCDLMAPEQSFATSNLTLALQARDVSCRITGCREGTQVAHICPQKEVEWWYGNGMSRYNVGPANTLDDLSNALLLRTDLHIAFDKPKFVFVPKPSSDPVKPQLVIHLVEASAEMEYLYHNRSLHPLHSSIETLFARFAWSIFPLLDAFLTGRERRRLLLATENGALLDKDGFVSWERCAQFSRKRSQSPKKRKPEARPVTNNDIRLSATADASRPRKRHRSYTVSRPGSPEPGDSPDCVLDRDTDLSNHLLIHCEDDLGQSSTSPILASPASVPTLYARTSFRSIDSDNLEHQLPSTGSPPFTGVHNPADPTTLAHTWLEQERLRSDIHNAWEEDEAWAKEAWTGSVVLDEEKARKWLEISGAEFLESENERTIPG